MIKIINKKDEQVFFMEKDGYNITFGFEFINFWKLEDICIENRSSKKRIIIYPTIHNNCVEKMNIVDSFNAYRHIRRENLTDNIYKDDDFLKNIIKEHSYKLSDNLYEQNTIFIGGDENSYQLVVDYDSKEDGFIKSYSKKDGHYPQGERIKVETPASVLFNLELSVLSSEIAYSAYNAFMSEVAINGDDDKGISKIQLKDIDLDLSDLKEWFEKERKEFRGYGYLLRNNKEITTVTPRDIAESTARRKIGESTLEVIQDNGGLSQPDKDIQLDVENPDETQK